MADARGNLYGIIREHSVFSRVLTKALLHCRPLANRGLLPRLTLLRRLNINTCDCQLCNLDEHLFDTNLEEHTCGGRMPVADV